MPRHPPNRRQSYTIQPAQPTSLLTSQLCASRSSSNANQMGDPPIKLRAHPPHDDDVLRALERAVLAAMLDYARGDGGADALQSLQFFDRGGVDVDALFVLRTGN